MIAFYIIWIGFLLYVVLDNEAADEEGGESPEGGQDVEALRTTGQKVKVDEDEDEDDGTGKTHKKKKSSKKAKKGSRKQRRMDATIKAMGLLLLILVSYIFWLKYMQTLGGKASLVVPTVAEINQVKVEQAERIEARWQPPPPQPQPIYNQDRRFDAEGRPITHTANMQGVHSKLQNALRKKKTGG